MSSQEHSKRPTLSLDASLVQDNVPIEILPKVFIGSIHAAFNNEALHELGITHILNASRLPPSFPKQYTYLSIDLRDKESANILSCIPAANIFIEAGVESGGVLIHCFGGRSRSAAFVAAYMISSYNMSYETAIAAIRKQRSVVSVNKGFEIQLVSYSHAHCNIYLAQQLLLFRRIQLLKQYRGHADLFLVHSGQKKAKAFKNGRSSGQKRQFADVKREIKDAMAMDDAAGREEDGDGGGDVDAHETTSSSKKNHFIPTEDLTNQQVLQNSNGFESFQDPNQRLAPLHLPPFSPKRVLSASKLLIPQDGIASYSADNSNGYININAQESKKVARMAINVQNGAETPHEQRQIRQTLQESTALDISTSIELSKSPYCRLSTPGSQAVRIIPPLRGLERTFCCSWCNHLLFCLANVVRLDLSDEYFDYFAQFKSVSENRSSNDGDERKESQCDKSSSAVLLKMQNHDVNEPNTISLSHSEYLDQLFPFAPSVKHATSGKKTFSFDLMSDDETDNNNNNNNSDSNNPDNNNGNGNSNPDSLEEKAISPLELSSKTEKLSLSKSLVSFDDDSTMISSNEQQQQLTPMLVDTETPSSSSINSSNTLNGGNTTKSSSTIKSTSAVVFFQKQSSDRTILKNLKSLITSSSQDSYKSNNDSSNNNNNNNPHFLNVGANVDNNGLSSVKTLPLSTPTMAPPSTFPKQTQKRSFWNSPFNLFRKNEAPLERICEVTSESSKGLLGSGGGGGGVIVDRDVKNTSGDENGNGTNATSTMYNDSSKKNFSLQIVTDMMDDDNVETNSDPNNNNNNNNTNNNNVFSATKFVSKENHPFTPLNSGINSGSNGASGSNLQFYLNTHSGSSSSGRRDSRQESFSSVMSEDTPFHIPTPPTIINGNNSFGSSPLKFAASSSLNSMLLKHNSFQKSERPSTTEKLRWLERVNLLVKQSSTTTTTTTTSIGSANDVCERMEMAPVNNTSHQNPGALKISKLADDDDDALLHALGSEKFVYLEYMNWMGLDIFESSMDVGEVNCYNCKKLIGAWTWSPTEKQSHAGQLISPIIRIHKKAVRENALTYDNTPGCTPRPSTLS